MTLGVALIGCGLIGGKRIAALPPGVSLRTAFDVVPRRAEAVVAAAGGDARAAPSPAGALTADGVDIAIIATAHRDLAALAGEAAEAGHHILIEKPGACRPAQLRAVEKALEASGRVGRVGFNHRFHPGIQKAKALLNHGDYGPALYVRGRYGHGGRIGYDKEWRADPAISGGGELLDQGIHLIDLTRFFEGEVELAFAELPSLYWPMPVEDNAFLCLRLATGGVAWLHASWTEWKNLFSLEIAHRSAKLDLEGLGGSYGIERLTLHEMRPEMGPPDTSAWEWPRVDGSWRAELVDMVTAIEGGPSTGATVADAIAALNIVEAAYES